MMNIIIPMAGAGSRFSQAGFKLPKPLIEVHGKPMYQWAANSLPLDQAGKLVFIIRQDEFTDQLTDDIAYTYAGYDPDIIVIKNLTRGQAETVFLAANALDLNTSTLIHNADTAFESMTMPDANSFGGLVTFESAPDDARWSFARVDEVDTDKVVEVREKQIISRYASTGTYYFNNTEWMLSAIEHQLAEGLTEQGEFYIAPLYNQAIADGHYIELLHCHNFTGLGTPEELKAAWHDIPQRLGQQTLPLAI